MSSHLEIRKPSGRELIPLGGGRVTVGKSSANLVALKDDSTVSRFHAVLENLGSLGRSGMWVVATAPISTAKGFLPNGSCVLETNCEWAIHGWSSGR